MLPHHVSWLCRKEAATFTWLIGIGVNSRAVARKTNTLVSPAVVSYNGHEYNVELSNECFVGRGVRNVTLSEGIKTIGSCFQSSSLEYLSLPSTITTTSLTNLSFYNCRNLKRIDCHALTPPTTDHSTRVVKTYADGNGATVEEPIVIRVPAEAIDKYRENVYWVGYDKNAHNALYTLDDNVELYSVARSYYAINFDTKEATLWKAAEQPGNYMNVPSSITYEKTEEYPVTELYSY